MAHVYNPTKGIYVKGTQSNIRIAEYPKTEKDKKIDADSKYRRMVYKAIGAGIESGLTIEEAIKKELVYMGEKATIEKHINSRIRMLYASDQRLDNLFADVSIYPIKRKISRKQIIAEIDRLVAFLYGLNEETLENILHTFSKYYSEKEVEAYF